MLDRTQFTENFKKPAGVGDACHPVAQRGAAEARGSSFFHEMDSAELFTTDYVKEL